MRLYYNGLAKGLPVETENQKSFHEHQHCLTKQFISPFLGQEPVKFFSLLRATLKRQILERLEQQNRKVARKKNLQAQRNTLITRLHKQYSSQIHAFISHKSQITSSCK